MKPCRDKSRDMCHIHHQHGTHLIADLPELLKINEPCIRTRTCDNHFGLMLQRKLPHLIIIKKSVVIHTIRHYMEILSRHIDRGTMCQMTTVVKIHSHNRIARLKHCKLDCHICLRAGMRLYICIITAKKLLCTLNCKVFHHIDALTAAIVTLSGIPLRIFIGQRAAHCRHHGLAHPVLGRNQFNMAILPLLFRHNSICNLWVNISYFVK